MPFSSRRLSAAFAASILMLLVTSCSPDKVTGPGAPFQPGVTLHDAIPDACTSQATCIGKPGTGVPELEVLQVCKVYPTGTVNPPAIVVHLDVVTQYPPDAQPSPTSLDYTIQPNACLKLWFTPGGATVDTVKVREIVPTGYTSSSQISTIVRNPDRTTTTSAPSPASSATSITGITGGPGIRGLTITFTNTPIPQVPDNTASLGDFVWNDLNANGIQDAGEPGIPGVPIMLSNGMTTTTDANGAYAFMSLPAGIYTVTVGTPAGFAPSPTGAGTPSTDNNGSGTSVTLATSADNTIDFGFYRLGSIGDFVWNDLNHNGIQESGEPGIAGVTVSLSTGATTVTDANGAYSFPNLAPGNYTVTVATPATFVGSPTGEIGRAHV